MKLSSSDTMFSGDTRVGVMGEVVTNVLVKGSNLQLRHPDELLMQTTQRAPRCVSFVMRGD